jgi:hypothetical protein
VTSFQLPTVAPRPCRLAKAAEYAPGATMPGAVRVLSHCCCAAKRFADSPPPPPFATPPCEERCSSLPASLIATLACDDAECVRFVVTTPASTAASTAIVAASTSAGLFPLKIRM